MSNVKVHFVISDQTRFPLILAAADVRYNLFSCYQYIKSKDSNQNMKIGRLFALDGPFKHSIMDSGLFTMMFGADSNGEKTPEQIREWMHRIVAFVLQNNITASIVECDCQKLISPEYAWQLRREMRCLLPDKEIINVFHLEDGEVGFRKLVDFSDYIAISVPELRIAQPKTYKNTVCALSRMARKQKPSIKIHLLGCTEQYLLERNTFCTSADSSSWTGGVRFGSFDKKHHISQIKEEKREKAIATLKEEAIKYDIELSPNCFIQGTKAYNWMSNLYYEALYRKNQYRQWAGNQD